MSCIRLDTDMLLANYFAKDGLNSDSATMDDLTLFLNYLADCLPGYVSSDLSEKQVERCVEEHPGYYQLSWTADDTLVVRPRRTRPTRDYINKDYSDCVSQRIAETTTFYRDLPPAYKGKTTQSSGGGL